MNRTRGHWRTMLVGAAIAVGGALAVPSDAWALYCDPPGAAEIASVETIAAVDAFTAAAITAQTEALIVALQGHAAQLSSNIQAQVSGIGMIEEAKSSQDTQRLVQSDQMQAIKANQFSSTQCQAITGAGIAVAAAAAAVPDRVLRSQANARRTSGNPDPANSVAPAQAATKMFNDRKPEFCDPVDPACAGSRGSRPDGDHMPGAILAMSRLPTPLDDDQAKNVVQNLTQPFPTPALTARQIASTDGRATYLRRKSYDTMVTLAKDITTDIVEYRRLPIVDPTYYNSLATEAGLPTATGNVSIVDMDNMRYRDRFNQNYGVRLDGLGDPVPLLREVAHLNADKLQQGLRTNELLESENLLLSSMLSTMVEAKVAATAGNAQ